MKNSPNSNDLSSRNSRIECVDAFILPILVYRCQIRYETSNEQPLQLLSAAEKQSMALSWLHQTVVSKVNIQVHWPQILNYHRYYVLLYRNTPSTVVVHQELSNYRSCDNCSCFSTNNCSSVGFDILGSDEMDLMLADQMQGKLSACLIRLICRPSLEHNAQVPSDFNCKRLTRFIRDWHCVVVYKERNAPRKY